MARFLGDTGGFLTAMLARLDELKVDVSAMQMDHVCFRVETEQEYEQLKGELLGAQSTLLHEAMIGGRPIATFKLSEPIVHGDRRVFLVELPSPKKTSFYKRGLEHAEFVLPQGVSFDHFMAQHSHLTFDLDAINKEINPDVRLALSETVSVKFHHAPLDAVIKYEKAHGI